MTEQALETNVSTIPEWLKSKNKSAFELQAEADAAYLLLILARGKELGLIGPGGKVKEDDCRELLDHHRDLGTKPRADVLENAKLLDGFHDLRRPREYMIDKPDGVCVTVRMKEVDKTDMRDVTPIYAVTEKSARQQVPDILWCKEGLLVRCDAHFFLLSPRELYSVVADAYGLPVEPAPGKRLPMGGFFGTTAGV